MAERTTNDFAERYRRMDESELMQIARTFETLHPLAQEAIKAEFRNRSLEPPLLDEGDPLDPEWASLVTVRRYRDLSEALVARAVLEGEGIRCFLRDENTIRLDWTLSNFMGGLRLQVSSDDVERAERILTAPAPASFAVDSGPDFIQPICPRCGSLDVVADDTGRRVAMASTMAPGLPLLVGVPALVLQPEGVWKCLHCGCRWQETDDPDEPTFVSSPVD